MFFYQWPETVVSWTLGNSQSCEWPGSNWRPKTVDSQTQWPNIGIYIGIHIEILAKNLEKICLTSRELV